MALKNGLCAHWKLEEATGATRNDSGPNALNLSDADAAGAQGTGKIGYCWSNPATAGKYLLRSVDDAALSMGDIDFTIAAWLNIATLADDLCAISKGDNGVHTNEYRFGVHLSGTRMFALNVGNGTVDNWAYASTFGTPSTGVWCYVIGWHDATANTINMCVNNGTVDSQAYTTGSYDSAYGFRLGCSANGLWLWNGLIDEASVWKRVITSTERTMLYNGGAGLPFEQWDAGKGGTQVYVMAFKRLMDEMKRGLLPPVELQRRWRALGAQI